MYRLPPLAICFGRIQRAPERSILLGAQVNFAPVVCRPDDALGGIVRTITLAHGPRENAADQAHRSRGGARTARHDRAAPFRLYVRSRLSGDDIADERPQIGRGQVLHGAASEERDDMALNSAPVDA